MPKIHNNEKDFNNRFFFIMLVKAKRSHRVEAGVNFFWKIFRKNLARTIYRCSHWCFWVIFITIRSDLWVRVCSVRSPYIKWSRALLFYIKHKLLIVLYKSMRTCIKRSLVIVSKTVHLIFRYQIVQTKTRFELFLWSASIFPIPSIITPIPPLSFKFRPCTLIGAHFWR